MILLSSSFTSVDDFLRKAREAKTSQRPDVEEFINDHFEDPHLIAIPPVLGDQITELVGTYGDEALRQLALFCMGKWFGIHTAYIEELMANENHHAALSTTMDATRISQCITILETVSSFGGSDEWRAMVRDLAIGAVNDAFNQRGDADNE